MTDSVVDRGAPHHSEAAEHAAAAAELQARVTEACADVPEARRSTCPLAGGGQFKEVEGRVEIALPSSAGTAEELTKAVECHRAHMAFDGLEHAPSCPLAVQGATATATAGRRGSITLRIAAEGDEQVAEVRRRVQAMPDLTAATHHGAHHH
ncbi:MAG: hypothetical protein HYY06_24640 [Deltaproteobacteria bacterium]|nr:hypothetical protein [Deltaproteobacteria bacterium]